MPSASRLVADWLQVVSGPPPLLVGAWTWHALRVARLRERWRDTFSARPNVVEPDWAAATRLVLRAPQASVDAAFEAAIAIQVRDGSEPRRTLISELATARAANMGSVRTWIIAAPCPGCGTGMLLLDTSCGEPALSCAECHWLADWALARP